MPDSEDNEKFNRASMSSIQTTADMKRELKSKPFLEERLSHGRDSLHPESHKMCPHYVVFLEKRQSLGASSAGLSMRSDMEQVVPRPGPDNLFDALAVLAIEVKLRNKGKLGMLDLNHPSLNLMSFVPAELA
ncbi:hypothetical protein GUITHDRAFT_150938 [Guillardia theta CCMP2712]|uniref:Uncharacterized protein n=1 Tax=Guillardia theta (strain CCMP2712) TaxID=905079 RepID=L1JTC4_GUITC|nr:hypothetical protein GUITHDRAFT_150938 [Guillardia theta CCMP2712]EKX51574.1 hypothetical protein GUITHDRAFT_150938 [Guillardia theta CCMP2712]|eukprot:XP_005838554.1 hypothetical protein GUITHDRAFT_150938 [Guillardia theta CCMP2712]